MEPFQRAREKMNFAIRVIEAMEISPCAEEPKRGFVAGLGLC